MPLQTDVNDWITRALGEDRLYDRKERAFRFLEEALELVQAVGVTIDEVEILSDYTFNRPVGEPHQEVAGAFFTLLALSTSLKVDAEAALFEELERVSTPEKMAAIRAKADAAPEGPLPQ